MKKEYDAYLAVTLNGDDIEIQVDGHAGDVAQIAAMVLADVIVQSSPEKKQAVKMLDDMKNRLDGMLDEAWDARSSEIKYGESQSVQWHGEDSVTKHAARAAMARAARARLEEGADAGCFGDCAVCSGATVDDRADNGSLAQDADNGLPS